MAWMSVGNQIESHRQAGLVTVEWYGSMPHIGWKEHHLSRARLYEVFRRQWGGRFQAGFTKLKPPLMSFFDGRRQVYVAGGGYPSLWVQVIDVKSARPKQCRPGAREPITVAYPATE